MRTFSALANFVAACIAVLSAAVYAQTAPADPAQGYPARSIRFIAPYPAGGTSDILGRFIGQKMTERWGQQIVIEARPGAAGLIGTEAVVRAQPDGYTLLITDMGSVLISYLAQAKPSFDYLRDLTPVMALTFSPHVLCSHPSLPVTNVKELIALAKRRPGELNFAASLAGAPLMAGIDFASRAGIRWTYITGRGGMQTIMDVVSGQADVMFNGMLPVMPQIHSGRLRLLAITSAERLPTLPDTPTVAELGMPGFLTGSWQGLLAPAGTPPEILSKLHVEISRILQLPDIKEKLAVQGTTPLSTSPADTAQALRAERDRVAKLMRDSSYKFGQ